MLQLVKDPLISRHNECLVRHLTGGADNLRGRPHVIGQFDYGGRRFGVHQYRSLRMDLLEIADTPCFELLVHDTGAIPQQHIGP